MGGFQRLMDKWTSRLTPIDPLDRFLSNIVVEDRGYITPCAVWTGRSNGGGYGVFSTGYLKPHTSALAHVWFYEQCVGPVPPETPHLDHLCRTKLCVELTHLEPVTQAENNARTAGVPSLRNKELRDRERIKG